MNGKNVPFAVMFFFGWASLVIGQIFLHWGAVSSFWLHFVLACQVTIFLMVPSIATRQLPRWVAIVMLSSIPLGAGMLAWGWSRPDVVYGSRASLVLVLFCYITVAIIGFILHRWVAISDRRISWPIAVALAIVGFGMPMVVQPWLVGERIYHWPVEKLSTAASYVYTSPDATQVLLVSAGDDGTLDWRDETQAQQLDAGVHGFAGGARFLGDKARIVYVDDSYPATKVSVVNCTGSGCDVEYTYSSIQDEALPPYVNCLSPDGVYLGLHLQRRLRLADGNAEYVSSIEGDRGWYFLQWGDAGEMVYLTKDKRALWIWDPADDSVVLRELEYVPWEHTGGFSLTADLRHCVYPSGSGFAYQDFQTGVSTCIDYEGNFFSAPAYESPVWLSDSKVVYVSETDQLHLVDVITGRVSRLNNSLEFPLSAAYGPEADTVYWTGIRDGRQFLFQEVGL